MTTNSVQTQQKLIAMTSEQPYTFKFNPKTTTFGKVNCNVVCRSSVTNRHVNVLKLLIIMPIILKLFINFGTYYSQIILGIICQGLRFVK